MYRMYPVLYDMTLKDYKNEKMNENVCQKIAEELQHVTDYCVQSMGVDEHLCMPTVWLVNHDTSWYIVWKPDKSHCCMFLFSLCTLRLKFDRVFVALSPAIFTLCVSLHAAWSLIAVSLFKLPNITLTIEFNWLPKPHLRPKNKRRVWQIVGKYVKNRCVWRTQTLKWTRSSHFILLFQGDNVKHFTICQVTFAPLNCVITRLHNRGRKRDHKARFPLGDYFRAKRLFLLSCELSTGTNQKSIQF